MKILKLLLYPVDIAVGLVYALLWMIAVAGGPFAWILHIWSTCRWWQILAQIPDKAWTRWLSIIIPPGISEIGCLVMCGWSWGFGLCTVVAGLAGFGTDRNIVPVIMVPFHLYLVWRKYIADVP